MGDKDWSEEDEDDPVKIQKEALALQKEFMAKLKADEAKAQEREAMYAAQSPVAAAPYEPPSFDEVSAVLKRVWERIEEIMPAAGDRVKAGAFQTLLHAAAPRQSFM